jgi:hypothetical protein
MRTALWDWRPRVTVRRRRLRLVAKATSVSMPVPRVRRERPPALSTLAFDRPTAFRALFRRPTGAPFLAEGTPERDLMNLLAAPSFEEAAAAANPLAEHEWVHAGPEAVFAELRGLALGEIPLAALWGEDRAADGLRLRILRAVAGEPEPELPEMRWGRFLRWAGERLVPSPPSALPLRLLRVAAASLAAVGGYRFAFEALVPDVSAKPGAERFDVLSLLSLRAALEDAFVPAFVEWLVPAGALRRAGVLPRDPWAGSLLAVRAFGEHGNIPAVVHLTAALLAADLRERVLTFAGREAASLWRRPWWARVPVEAEGAFADAVAMVRSQALTLVRGERKPWPKGWGGPDLAPVLEMLQALLGRRASGLELFLDDRLAVAAVYAVIGYVPSATAQLDAASVSPPLSEARGALHDALGRSGPTREPASLLAAGGWDRDADRLYRQLRGTPDPSVELGSPHWLLEGARGALMAHLVKDGRRRTATAVRSVLERADLQNELRPFWILRGTGEDTQAVYALAVWAAQRGEEPVPEAEWIRFVEAVCRAHQAREEE